MGHKWSRGERKNSRGQLAPTSRAYVLRTYLVALLCRNLLLRKLLFLTTFQINQNFVICFFAKIFYFAVQNSDF